MLALYCWLAAWLRSEKGQDLIEYALIIGLMVVVAILALNFLGTQISSLWSAIGNWLKVISAKVPTT